jgi:hypothetical protein
MKEEKKENYTVEELVKIGDHIHNCTTAFIIADIDQKGEHNVLITAKGKRDEIAVMLLETMMKDQRVAEIIELAFANYLIKTQEQQNNN